MLRALLKIMKGNRLAVGLFVFLLVGVAFPRLRDDHEHRVLATHHHHSDTASAVNGQDEHDRDGLAMTGRHAAHSHAGKPSTSAQLCGDECCALGCFILTAAAGSVFERGYFKSDRLPIQDRHVDGVAPLTIERPPRS